MQKNPGENLSTVEVDPVTGEYVIKLPEWVISEFGWYEGTEVNMDCLLYTSPSPRDATLSRMPSSA